MKQNPTQNPATTKKQTNKHIKNRKRRERKEEDVNVIETRNKRKQPKDDIYTSSLANETR